MSTRKFYQLVHTLSYGDAISGEVLTLARVAKQLGYEPAIFALNIHPHYKSGAYSVRIADICDFPPELLEQSTRIGQSDCIEVVLHYSLGSPLNQLYRRLSGVTRSLIFHNLTPPHWFRAVNPRIVRDLEGGFSELPELCAISTRIIADSAFNAAELANLGFEAQVLPLPVDQSRWQEPPNAGLKSLVAAEGGVHLLHVGRIAPNKCIEDIIKIFHFFHYHFERNSRLWLVGIDIDTEIYSFALKRLARELEVDAFVNFVGGLADSEVRALYESSHAYICMSEHEGFCLPVLEAMYFGLPVIAYKSSAIADTVGNGGVLVLEKRHADIAALINLICRDQSMRTKLVQAGKDRVAGFTFEKFLQDFAGIFEAKAGEADSAVISGDIGENSGLRPSHKLLYEPESKAIL